MRREVQCQGFLITFGFAHGLSSFQPPAHFCSQRSWAIWASSGTPWPWRSTMLGLTGSRAATSVQEEPQAHVRSKLAVWLGMLPCAPAQLPGSAHRHATVQQRSQAHARCKRAVWLGTPACSPKATALTTRYHAARRLVI